MPDRYAVLRRADKGAFAWEWLRRTSIYQDAWKLIGTSISTPAPPPKQFGLERFEDPALPVPFARPIWSADIDPSVIRATVVDPYAPPSDRVDLWRLLPLVSVAIDDDQVEHLLLSDGTQALRIDVVGGTLIGNPAALRYGLYGLTALQGPLAALSRLIAVVTRGGFKPVPSSRSNIRDRWILELRVADALLAGATPQQIARGLFGDAIAASRWRTQNPSYRQRISRLVKAARFNLSSSPNRKWFAERSGSGEAVSS